jgi:YidC/Oxa1 family membrane protein insertase
MKDEHRSLIAAGLSFLVLIGWYFFYGSKHMATPPPPSTVSTAPASPLSQGLAVPPEPSTPGGQPSGPQPENRITKETPLMTMEWTNLGARLSKILLKDYRQDIAKDSPPINLLPFEGERSLALLCRDCSGALPADELYKVTRSEDRQIQFEATSGGIKVTKAYDWSNDQSIPYVLNLHVVVENQSDKDFHGRVGLGWRSRQYPAKPKGPLSFLQRPTNHRSFLYKLGQDVKHIPELKAPSEFRGEVPWAGIEDRYFLISLISRGVSSDQILQLQKDGDFLDLAVYPTEMTVPAGGRQEEAYSFYVGPKERSILMQAGVGLEKAVDYGWFGVIAIPILKLLQVFHSVVKNWGLAVIALTLFIKLLMNPLTVKSMHQMKEMQKLQPKIAALKEKYQNDRQRLNAETMALFRTHKVNPMGGCLPMVLQMPIYIALYKVIYNAIELYHAPFVGFYRDLSAPDPYFILPILLGIGMVLQQKLTPSPSADPAQKQMMMFMPIMFTGFMLFLPVGLVLYIFVNTLFTVIQQWMYQKGIRWRDLVAMRKVSV